MFMFSKKLARLLAVTTVALLPTNEIAAQNGDIVMTNPLNLKYLFEESGAVHRTCADPVIVLYHDRYYLFSSHASGYSWSDNLRDWTHRFSDMPLVRAWAPAVMVYDDYIYYMGFGDNRVFRTKDPENDKWEQVTWSELKDRGDPDFFVDNDGKTYFLWGCSPGGAMQGQEFDPRTFKPTTGEIDLMPANGKRLGWEVPGDDNEKTNENGWNEGVSMVHEGDYYYFFYATPGTEYTTYCSGAYVGKSPLGPFEPMVGSPYAIKPSGFFTGGGHGHPFKDRYGNHWYVASLIIGARDHYERRIGIFPAFYNNGYGHAIMDNFDHPFVVPNRKMDFEKESILLDMNLLSSNKRMTASSTKGNMTPDKAADDYIRSWWSANSGNSGEWLQMDLGRTMNVQAIQVCFTDEDFNSRRYDNNIPVYKYVVEGSTDGNNWHMIADRSNNNKDQILELLETNDNVRYIRVTNRTTFNPGKFAVTELRVFGKDNVATPVAVGNFNAAHGSDSRRIQFSWDPVDNAEGYIVRWGATPDHIDHAARVYGNFYDYGFFDTMSDYYVSVQPFNEAGLGENSRIIKVAARPSITNYVQGDGEWLKQSYISVNQGAEFKSGPWADRDGSWRWTGPNGFTSNDREIRVTGMNAAKAGAYTVTFRGNDGSESSSVVMVNLNGSTEITPYVLTGNTWQQSATASLLAGGTVNMGPHPNVNEGWRWTGPNGFTSNNREISIQNISPAQGGIYTATYTNGGQSTSYQFYIDVTGEGPELEAYASDKYGWRKTMKLAVTQGDEFSLGPQPQNNQNGTWSWTGPNGFTSNAREVTVRNATAANAGTYFATFVADNGVKSTTSITVNVVAQPLEFTPYVSTDHENWSQTNELSVELGGSFWVGPQINGNPWTEGTWLWTGPNGFTSTEREFSVTNITAANAGTYTAEFTDEYGRRTYYDIVVTLPNSTGINEAKAAKAEEAIYNVLGEKVNKPTTPGIYIIGNRKVVIGK